MPYKRVLSQVERGVRYRRVYPHEWGKMYVWHRSVNGANGAMSELVDVTSRENTVILCSLRLKTVQLIVPVWHPTGSAPTAIGVFPDPLEGGADVSLALRRWCAVRDSA